MKTGDGRTLKVTTREDIIRIGIRDRNGKSRVWEVFTIPDVKALETALKAAREKIARKQAKRARG
jgi:hypothetical protein